jgi:hypothetical protein
MWMPRADHQANLELIGKNTFSSINFYDAFFDRCQSDREISMVVYCESDATSEAAYYGTAGWQCLRFFPLPQGHGSFRPAVCHRAFCSL